MQTNIRIIEIMSINCMKRVSVRDRPEINNYPLYLLKVLGNEKWKSQLKSGPMNIEELDKLENIKYSTHETIQEY